MTQFFSSSWWMFLGNKGYETRLFIGNKAILETHKKITISTGSSLNFLRSPVGNSSSWRSVASKFSMSGALRLIPTELKDPPALNRKLENQAAKYTCIWVFPKIWENPQIIHLFIGFGTIIFTIHFGGFPPIFGNINFLLLKRWKFQSPMYSWVIKAGFQLIWKLFRFASREASRSWCVSKLGCNNMWCGLQESTNSQDSVGVSLNISYPFGK